MATAAILGSVVTAVGEIVDISSATNQPASPYRPSYWTGGKVTSISVPGVTASVSTSGQTNGQINAPLQTSTQTSAPTVYVFDGIGKRQHSHKATPTRIPTQTGAATTDHIVIEPTQVVLDVMMSDAMDSYAPGMWSGGPTKSIQAFTVLEQLRVNRQGLTITTRLMTYTNMALTDFHVVDDSTTMFGLKAVATFDQIMTGSVSSQSLSARPQLTASTNQEQIGTSAVPSSVANNNTSTTASTVPGAGT